MQSRRYLFAGRSGYIIRQPESNQDLVRIGHTASVPAWADSHQHTHSASDEFYFVIAGRLDILITEQLLSVRPREILMVRAGFPHAVLGGSGPISHFGLRAPATDGKHRPEVALPLEPLYDRYERSREICQEWGCRVPLEAAQNQNCWLFGEGIAKFASHHLALAYLNFPTTEAANAGIGTRHRLHYHQRSWEFYLVLHGSKTLQVESDLVKLQPGEILEVPPRVGHSLHSRTVPFEGFTLRVPVELNDKVEV